MMIEAYDIKTHNPRRVEVCDHCLRPNQVLHDTLKLGVTSSFSTQSCEDCLLFRLRLNHPTKEQEEIRKEREQIMRVVTERRLRRQKGRRAVIFVYHFYYPNYKKFILFRFYLEDERRPKDVTADIPGGGRGCIS